jgi:acetolactate synthase I/II/III large subunit
MPRKHRVVDHVVGHLAMVHAMCVTRDQLSYDDPYGNNRFGRRRVRTCLAAMFPGLVSVEITDLAGFSTALGVDGQSAASVECSARPSAEPIAMQQIPITKEERTDVAART